MKMKTEPGFVLLGVFLLLSMATILVTQIYYKATTYNSFVPVCVEKKEAQTIAKMGIALAINQLALYDQTLLFEKQDETKKNSLPKDEINIRNLLSVLLRVQNKWQTFEFDKNKDGFDATLKICITCHSGTIPFNELIDYTKKSFLKSNDFNGEEFFNRVIEKIPFIENKTEAFDQILQFIKKRKYKVSDITELLECRPFSIFKDKLFLIPEYFEKNLQTSYYLTDIFNSHFQQKKIHPALLSFGLRNLFDLNFKETEKKLDPRLLEKIITKMPVKKADWKKDWDTFLKPIYKKEYKSLPKDFVALLDSKFEPRFFSVLCYGKVGQVKQKLLVTIKRSFFENKEEFEVIKLYWL